MSFREDFVQRLSKERRRLSIVQPDLFGVLFPAFPNLFLEQNLERPVPKPILPLGRVVHDDIRHKGPSKAARFHRRILAQEGIVDSFWPAGSCGAGWRQSRGGRCDRHRVHRRGSRSRRGRGSRRRRWRGGCRLRGGGGRGGGRYDPWGRSRRAHNSRCRRNRRCGEWGRRSPRTLPRWRWRHGRRSLGSRDRGRGGPRDWSRDGSSRPR